MAEDISRKIFLIYLFDSFKYGASYPKILKLFYEWLI